MKKIAISLNFISRKYYDETGLYLDVNFFSLFKKCDFFPILIPYVDEPEVFLNKQKIDGIFLTGGTDLYSVSKNELSKSRYSHEKKIINFSIDKNIPLLGMCRGMQIIGEFFGGNLKRVSNEVRTRSKLTINRDSKFYNELNKIQTVNSYHKYALQDLNQEILISATNQNNVIKAIEHKELNIFGQMWHSEREKTFSSFEIKLIKKVFDQ